VYQLGSLALAAANECFRGINARPAALGEKYIKENNLILSADFSAECIHEAVGTVNERCAEL